ncbi:MAG: EAL domain-containing protein [Methylophilaceae bacterium]|jgi:EAL domain-containing protein (putative c-di-GMP-specific phosphodiesterase class I)|nr:EAL domain-containing protein [Methylophilaceae bacterium]
MLPALPDEIQAHRVVVAMRMVAAVCMLTGLGWMVLFAILQQWFVFWLDAVLAAIGLITYLLLSRGRTRLATVLLFPGLFCVLMVLSLFLDVPSDNTPRVVHLYFLAIAFLAYLILQNEHKWLRYGVIGSYLAAFVIFSSSNIALPLPGADDLTMLGDNIRLVGAWVNVALATAMLCLVLYVMQADFALRTRIGRELSIALWDHQFVLYFQPQVDSRGKILGAEALLRWQHPVLGLQMPGDIIPAIEQNGLIVPIGHWVLNAACHQLELWAARPATANLVLSVNVSAQQFHETHFVPQVLSIIKRTGINPSRLKLELTESILIDDMEDVIEKMNLLKAAGVGLVLDDFGTGYSSLNYLRRLPLSQLKIDQTFVRDILDNLQDQAIARTIIVLGAELGFEVIAEGVENERQLQCLIENGCMVFQGYFFSAPVPIQEFGNLMQRDMQSG